MNILLKRGNLNENRSVPNKFMLDIEDSVIKSDVIKSFDCIIDKQQIVQIFTQFLVTCTTMYS